jgi:ankyrin repeat protein
LSTALFESIAKGEVESVRAALTADPALASARDAQGVSGLLFAAYNHQLEIVELFVTERTEFDVFEAAALGRLSTLRPLLHDHPDLLDAYSADGFTPLHLACFFAQEQAADFLVDRGASVHAVAQNPSAVRPLHSAVAARNTPIVETLLRADASVNARQAGGWTALQAAAKHGNVALCRTLLVHGADPNAEADDGQTALDLARANGSPELLALFEGR